MIDNLDVRLVGEGYVPWSFERRVELVAEFARRAPGGPYSYGAGWPRVGPLSFPSRKEEEARK